ncbi:hypothetical protein [Lentzea cavernae]|uniref:PemK-like, MazF-like toxin of type II toxin-antitoxin system n=1 Tax=Lentzea cavernae TaxID=2020703 RepID=A0ABQ3MNE0_9PSEU|nr:hypothetical protein [Lentzea cavernae]GHH40470.1 hypothetical protein GCM10017774_33890 [Lentzea cavernae]
MPSLRVGSVRKCADKKVVVLKTGVKEGDDDAVKIAPLTRTKPSDGPGVEFRDTLYGAYWVLVGQVTTVRVASLNTVWGGIDRVKPAVMKIVLRESGA